MERIMTEQYPDRARVYKGNRAAKNIRLKKRNTGKKIVIAALLIFIAAIITILIVLQRQVWMWHSIQSLAMKMSHE